MLDSLTLYSFLQLPFILYEFLELLEQIVKNLMALNSSNLFFPNSGEIKLSSRLVSSGCSEEEAIHVTLLASGAC
jgi:hypothetical protein